MRIKNLKHWTKDYLRVVRIQGRSLFYKKPPEHFLGFVKENKIPVVLIQGLLNSWHTLEQIGNKLSLEGHPVFILNALNRNTKKIPDGADLIGALIEQERLDNVVIVAHSKGGLIGKYFLAFHNASDKVKKLITIATPFAGSKIVKIIPLKSYQELGPQSKIIKDLNNQKAVNRKIVSIYGVFDNHVWPLSSSHLEGAKNIEVNSHGHHSILFDNEVIEIILKEVKNV